MMFKPSSPVGTFRSVFATPLIDRQLPIATPEFLAAMRDYVLAMEQRDSGKQVSNAGGWHSTETFFDQKDEIVQLLGIEILKVAAEMTYLRVRPTIGACAADVAFEGGSWANVSRDGDYNKPHNHPGTIWSGVFYVSLGERDPEPSDNGAIEFMDPRGANVHGSKLRIQPKPGELLLFPSWLHHYVNPFKGKGERISIAFNTSAEVRPLE
jgi:uncharacterized protein (TIGR02466 family)